ncbi:CDP-diacylglycerol--glycerol-3-phosphate 3-phosphatidyltransferase [Clostridium sp. 'deep sea']|uniref:CDP-diacylglycerol--glycerol-3-phosphate 3-phosphatidyltransferase n=1 Tax=Clostridium sp. 'deep sea' TaxID=2779445 RepID=UPI001FAB9E7A|nr:CDP-diacylglycerol--glycerol-3-phosphate 3-phosphatidyltransferase [Clostridium sp. 'deep sea']
MPNIITFVRILTLPFLVNFLMDGSQSANKIALIIFLVASLTDFLDGFIARRFNLVSNLGKLLDPLADKLLVVSVLVTMIATGEVSPIVVLLILTREFAVTGLRAIVASEGVVIAASKYGKIKTVTQIVAITILILARIMTSGIWFTVGTSMLYIATLATVLSGIDYFYNARHVFK